MLGSVPCDCSTVANHHLNVLRKSSKSCQDSSTYRCRPLDISPRARSVSRHRRYLYLNSLLIMTTCDSWRTGTDLGLCPRIDPISSQPWSPRSQRLLFAWSCLSSESIIHVVNCSEVLIQKRLSSWLQTIHISEVTSSFLQNFRISHGDHAVDLSLLQHSSEVSSALDWGFFEKKGGTCAIYFSAGPSNAEHLFLQSSTVATKQSRIGCAESIQQIIGQSASRVEKSNAESDWTVKSKIVAWEGQYVSANTSEERTSAVLDLVNHYICSRLSLSSRFVILRSIPSSSSPRPMSQRKSSCKKSNHLRIRIDVVDRRHEDDPISEFFKSCSANCHSCLNRAENFH